MNYFPMFIDTTNIRCLIIGGGQIALRKVQVLTNFVMDITLIAPKIDENIKEYNIQCIEKEFENNDLNDYQMVIIATNDKDLNHQISMLCKEKNILVNTVDQKEDCTFIFPSYIQQEDVIAAFSSSGNSPVITQYLKEKNKEIMTPLLGEINAFLGNHRDTVKQSLTYDQRKCFYKEVLDLCLDNNSILTEDEFTTLLNKYMEK